MSIDFDTSLTTPLQKNAPSVGMQSRPEDLPMNGFPWISMSGLAADSIGYQRVPSKTVPLLQFPCKFMWHMLGCRVGPRTCQRISMDFDSGLGGGFHWIPTKSAPPSYTSLAHSCAICLECNVISRTCQRIAMDFDVGPGGGSHWIPPQSLFHSATSLATSCAVCWDAM